MARTRLRGGDFIEDGTIVRTDLDTTTAGAAVIRRVIAGTNITFSSTGVDSGTGDVTINATGGGGSLTLTAVDLDFTLVGTRKKSVDIADVSALTTSKVFVSLSGVQPNGVYVDELEDDPLQVYGSVPVDGTVRLTVTSINNSVVHGQRRVLYALG